MASSQASPTTQGSPTARRFETAELALAGLAVLGILVQSILAGQFLTFGSPIELHGYIGSAVFVFQGIIVILVFMDRAAAELKITAIVIIGFMFAQIGLGYAARASHSLSAYHIPLGVVLFGAATWQLARLRSR